MFLPLAFFAIPTPPGLTPNRVRRTPLTLGESPHTVRIDPCMQRVCCLPVQASSAA